MSLYSAYTNSSPRIGERPSPKKGTVANAPVCFLNPVTGETKHGDSVLLRRQQQTEEKAARLLKARQLRAQRRREIAPATDDLLTMGTDTRPQSTPPGVGMLNDPHRIVRQKAHGRINPVTMTFVEPDVAASVETRETLIRERQARCHRRSTEEYDVIGMKHWDGRPLTPRTAASPTPTRRTQSRGVSRVFQENFNGDRELEQTNKSRRGGSSHLQHNVATTPGLLTYTEAHQVHPMDRGSTPLRGGKKKLGMNETGSSYNILTNEDTPWKTLQGAWTLSSEPSRTNRFSGNRTQSGVHYNILSGLTPR